MTNSEKTKANNEKQYFIPMEVTDETIVDFNINPEEVASTQTVKETVSISNNTNLRYKVVANTGHIPGVEMMNTTAMLTAMIKQNQDMMSLNIRRKISFQKEKQ